MYGPKGQKLSKLLARAHELEPDHPEIATWYAVALGRRVGLDGDYLEALRIGGMLHDIGKIGVPDYILLKPGRLDEEEFGYIREHPLVGERI